MLFPKSPKITIAIFLYILGLFMLTFYPYQFSTHSRGWDFDESLIDILQNILLFVPLGVLLYLALKRGWSVALLGALISFIIECVQLFSITRYSNPFDILGNGAGAWLGAFLAAYCFRAERTPFIAFAMTVLLLCWALAMRTGGVDPMLLLFVMWGVAGMYALSQAVVDRQRLQLAALFAWATAAALPLFRSRVWPKLVVLLLLLALGLWMARAAHPKLFRTLLRVGFSGTFFILALHIFANFSFESRMFGLSLLFLYSVGLVFVKPASQDNSLQS